MQVFEAVTAVFAGQASTLIPGLSKNKETLSLLAFMIYCRQNGSHRSLHCANSVLSLKPVNEDGEGRRNE
jgi:hypothetical protein